MCISMFHITNKFLISNFRFYYYYLIFAISSKKITWLYKSSNQVSQNRNAYCNPSSYIGLLLDRDFVPRYRARKSNRSVLFNAILFDLNFLIWAQQCPINLIGRLIFKITFSNNIEWPSSWSHLIKSSKVSKVTSRREKTNK
jgi:hypothetical protein